MGRVGHREASLCGLGGRWRSLGRLAAPAPSLTLKTLETISRAKPPYRLTKKSSYSSYASYAS